MRVSGVAPDLRSFGSDDPAIGAQRLAVDPGAVGTGEEGDGGGDVRRLAQALQRRQLGEAVDDLLRLAVQEQVREAPVTIVLLVLSWVIFRLLSFVAGHPLSMTKRWIFYSVG
jgi:hypothetical protein